MGGAFAQVPRIVGLGYQRHEIDVMRSGRRIGDPPRDRDASPGAQLAGPQLREHAVAVDGEQVVPRGDADPATGRELHLEDPIRRTLVPTGDVVVPDLEGVGIETDDTALQVLVDDFGDRPRFEPAVDQDHDRLARRQARVNKKSEPAKARLPLEPGDQIVGEGDAFEGAAEHELTGVEDERAVLFDVDELGEILLRLLRIDVGSGVVAEDAEQRVAVEVDRRRLDRRLVERIDHDAPGGELLADGAVGEDHRRRLPGHNASETVLTSEEIVVTDAAASAPIPEQVHDILTDKPTGFVATVRPDGMLSVTPVGLMFDGEVVRFSTTKDRKKYRNLRRDDRVHDRGAAPQQPEPVRGGARPRAPRGRRRPRVHRLDRAALHGRRPIPLRPAGTGTGDGDDRGQPRVDA